MAGDENFERAAAAHFGTPDGLNAMFVRGEWSEEDSGLDQDALDKFFGALSEKQRDALLALCEQSCAALAKLRGTAFFSVGKGLTHKKYFLFCSFSTYPMKPGLRLFDVILSIPTVEEPSRHRRLLTPLLEAIADLDETAKSRLARYWSKLSRERAATRLALFHQIITMRMLLPPPVPSLQEETSIVVAAKAMGVLYRANQLSSTPLRFTEFYNDTLNEQLRDMGGQPGENDLLDDFVKWLNRSHFSFCQTPFLLDCANKAQILKFESQFKQQQQRAQAMRNALHNAMLGNGRVGFNPFLVFGVRRDRLIQDTLENIVRHEPEDLRKELKV